MMFSDVQKTINGLQDEAILALGSHSGHAWGSGFLGAILADVLYYHVPASHRDQVLGTLLKRIETFKGNNN